MNAHLPLSAAPVRLTLLALTILLAACAMGPDYARPDVPLPASYKEAGPWRQAQPQVADAQHPWWEMFGDATLNGLMQQANQANQNIRVALAQYRQAQALADVAHAAYWPTVGMGLTGTRARTNSTGVSAGASRMGNDVNLSFSASWAPDLWGSVSRAVEAGDASVQASADDLAGAKLSIQGVLAQNYWQLRSIDLQRELYASTVAAYAKSLKLVQNQLAQGVALRSDVALAETQLKSTQALAADLEVQRGQLEHAIAVLVGKSPADFSLPPVSASLTQMQQALPAIPTGLPSQLLERRPDIAAAERRVAVANANVGVATAAFFPNLVLGASKGFNDASLNNLFSVPFRVWSVGPSLTQFLFDGGLRSARSDQAKAAYDGTVAQYRQTVLGGLQQVEDNLLALRVLSQEAELQNAAVTGAQQAEQSVTHQYRAGTASYLSVVTAQTLALTNQRAAAQILARQLAASVSLVLATGGGWSVATTVSGVTP